MLFINFNLDGLIIFLKQVYCNFLNYIIQTRHLNFALNLAVML